MRLLSTPQPSMAYPPTFPPPAQRSGATLEIFIDRHEAPQTSSSSLVLKMINGLKWIAENMNIPLRESAFKESTYNKDIKTAFNKMLMQKKLDPLTLNRLVLYGEEGNISRVLYQTKHNLPNKGKTLFLLAQVQKALWNATIQEGKNITSRAEHYRECISSCLIMNEKETQELALIQTLNQTYNEGWESFVNKTPRQVEPSIHALLDFFARVENPPHRNRVKTRKSATP